MRRRLRPKRRNPKRPRRPQKRRRRKARSTETLPLMTASADLTWEMEERETFDCPVIVKRQLARLAVDYPDLTIRGLYLQAVAHTYGIEIPIDVLRDRRRAQKN